MKRAAVILSVLFLVVMAGTALGQAGLLTGNGSGLWAGPATGAVAGAVADQTPETGVRTGPRMRLAAVEPTGNKLAGNESTGGESSAVPHAPGAKLGLVWVIPFIGILLSIAILPLLTPRFWHHHFGKISAFWALAFVLPFGFFYGADVALYEILHTMLLEYFPFILLLLALFTVSGGVRLKGELRGSPAVNTGLLAVGTAIASVMGTTGAAMLLIRPLLRANAWRRYNVHVVIFFIFLVANIGGSLSPLGDPPLFIGFLKGVDFFWPTRHLFAPMMLVSGLLLAIFFLLDSFLFRREEKPVAEESPVEEGLGIEGWRNILLLGGVIATVLVSGIWNPGITIKIYHVDMELQNLARDAILLLIVFFSVKATSAESRHANAFTWFPIVEVAKLFAGIFLTIVPAIIILKAGEQGAAAPLIRVLSVDGQPANALYFWFTGGLSGFLDNAPTYLVFFNTAGGDAEILMGPLAKTLLAISAGAVFMGAMTYIGNAPNFMVRAIAQERGIRMPSFFGYMAWSFGILLPIFALVTVVFFV